MSDIIKMFPSPKAEALTLLYLQNQDLSNLSPTELVDKYSEVYQEINRLTAFALPIRVR